MNFFKIFMMALFLSACGESPILNHVMEKNHLTNEYFQSRKDGYLFSKNNFSFSLDWISGPMKGENKFIVRAWDNDLGTINGPYQDLPEKFHVYLWMPDMGHGSAPVKIRKIATGEYEVSNAYFIMGGAWEIHFELLKNEVAVDKVILPLTL